MTCSECRELISDHLDGQLRGVRESQFLTHLDECDNCARVMHRIRFVKKRLSALPRLQLPDAFSFRIRRMLVAEGEREASWGHRVREWLSPSPQTAWAAVSGTVAAVASFALLWAIWAPGSFGTRTNIAETTDANQHIVQSHTRAVRYVLEQLPNRGDLIETTVDADTTHYTIKFATPAGVRSVSADF